MDEKARTGEGVGTIDEAWCVVEQASSSCHQGPEVTFKKEDITKVYYYFWDNYRDYADTSSYAVFRLKDGRWVQAWESADSSGHG